MASLVEELPAAPSATEKTVAVPVLTAPSATEKSVAVPAAPSANEKTVAVPAAPSATEKTVAITVLAAPSATEKTVAIPEPAAPSSTAESVDVAVPAAPSATEKSLVVKAPMTGFFNLKEIPGPTSAPEKSVASALRFLNTKGVLSRRDDDDDTSEKAIVKDATDDRLALDLSVPKPYSTDALGLFGEPTKLSQLLGLMEDGGARYGTDFSASGWWVSKEDKDAMVLKVPMPGLRKEHVKVTADKNNLVIKGEGDKDPEDGYGPARCSRRIALPADAFKMDQIKAEMKDGVLKVTVPKIKDEERKDVFQIKVE